MFVDFRQAFPSVDRNLLLCKLHQLGITGKIYRAIENTCRNPVCCLRINGKYSDFFQNNYGTLEGDCQSPTNFAIFLDGLLQELDASELGVYYGDTERLACLAYADDLVLLASSEDRLQKLVEILENHCKKWRLTVNVAKTKVLVFKKNYQTRDVQARITYNGHVVEQVKNYRYLGVRLDDVLSFKDSFKELS